MYLQVDNLKKDLNALKAIVKQVSDKAAKNQEASAEVVSLPEETSHGEPSVEGGNSTPPPPYSVGDMSGGDGAAGEDEGLMERISQMMVYKYFFRYLDQGWGRTRLAGCGGK